MGKNLQARRVRWLVGLTLLTALYGVGTAAPKSSTTEPKVELTSLWMEPDFTTRNFFDGPGGPSEAPAEGARYELLAKDTKGYSGGYDVRDAQGAKWSVKIGKEAQTEVTVSRILWGLGYHQRPIYLVNDWQLTGASVDQDTLQPARFRRNAEDAKVVGEWSWSENQFVGSAPFQGLLVVNLMLNNWDWKTSNNKIYDLPNATGGPTRVYIVGNWSDADKFYAVSGSSKMLPLRDSQKFALMSPQDNGGAVSTEIKPGGSFLFWAKYPAPPATAKKITYMTPHTPPFEDLPITEAQ